MNTILLAFVVSSGLAARLALAQDPGEKKVKMQDLPAAVQQAIKEHSKGATIRGLATEIEGGKRVYEAELTVQGHAKDLTFDEHGTIVSTEEETPLAKIPAAAGTAIRKAAANGKVLLVETVTEGGKTFYEAQISKGGKKSEVQVTASGQTVKP
jgi:uncharacterized membrane protein YkoI